MHGVARFNTEEVSLLSAGASLEPAEESQQAREAFGQDIDRPPRCGCCCWARHRNSESNRNWHLAKRKFRVAHWPSRFARMRCCGWSFPGMTFSLLGCVPALQNPYLESRNRNISLTRKHRHASNSCCGIFLGDTIHVTSYGTAGFAVSVPLS